VHSSEILIVIPVNGDVLHTEMCDGDFTGGGDLKVHGSNFEKKRSYTKARRRMKRAMLSLVWPSLFL
jgi:hypothetical protein